MQSYDALEAAWQTRPAGEGRLRLICLRLGAGEHATTEAARVSLAGGLEGDRWAADDGEKGRQITLMDARVATLVAGDHAPLHLAGDNLLVDVDLDVASLPVGARLRIGDVVLEVSAEPHLGCKKFSQRFGQDALRWINGRAHRERRLRGINATVVTPGTVRVGDAVRRV